MQVFDALIFALVEGITEFLPISSTGHLILTSKLLQIPQTDFVKTFEIAIQLGAILAVVVLYRKKFLTSKAVWTRVFAGFIPTAIIGFILYKFIKEFLLGNVTVTLLALFIGGILLIVAEKIHKKKETDVKSIEEMPLKTAVLVGVFQAFSVIPGVSRSAASIVSGLFLGMKREAAVEYSFLLAVPTMMAATGLDLVQSDLKFSNHDYMIMTIGFVGSFVVALFAVKFFVNYVRHHSFVAFGVYRIILALLFWLFIVR